MDDAPAGSLISDKFPNNKYMLLICMLISLAGLALTDRILVPPSFMQLVNERHFTLPNALFRIYTWYLSR